MIDSAGAADQPFRMGARTWRGVLARAGGSAVGACLVILIFALAFGWSEWVLAIGLIFFLATWLLVLGASAEWTIADQELRRRPWLSRSGDIIMVLGPQFEVVHERRHVWHLVPNGPALGAQPGRPWQTRRLVEAMEQAGVRINDWRGDWARRHRVLDTLGLLTLWGGLAGIIVMPAVRAAWPGLFTATAWVACSGAVFLGLVMDWLPWSMRNSARGG
jgi:hypothetical protein